MPGEKAAGYRDISGAPRAGQGGLDMCLAIPGEVAEAFDKHGIRFATVKFGGITREVCLEYTPEVGVGDFVLVHVGFAISKVDRDEAAKTWDTLTALGQMDELTES